MKPQFSKLDWLFDMREKVVESFKGTEREYEKTILFIDKMIQEEKDGKK